MSNGLIREEKAGGIAIPGKNGGMADPEDAHLLQQLAAGDHNALAILYDRHSTLLYTVIIRIVDEPAEAQDLLHDLYVSLARRAGSYRAGAGSPVGWLLTAARNLALDRVRMDKRRRELLHEAAQEPEKPFGNNAASAAGVGSDEAAILRNCVEALSGPQRKALEMAYFEGLTHGEISTQLAEPLGTIKARIRRGLMAVKTCVEGQQ
jgi:RNA polymerase sigma-70 factor, ECF subfamily